MTNNSSNNHTESTPLVQNDRNVLSGDVEGETLTTTKASATMTTIRRSATVRFVMLLLSATAVVLVVLGTSKTPPPTTATATATTTSSTASMVALLKEDQSYGDVVGAPTLPPLPIPQDCATYSSGITSRSVGCKLPKASCPPPGRADGSQCTPGCVNECNNNCLLTGSNTRYANSPHYDFKGGGPYPFDVGICGFPQNKSEYNGLVTEGIPGFYSYI